MKKVGKTTGQFRYDLNHISYNYTVEVRNRFKGLNLRNRVTEELWTEIEDTAQEAVIKTIPMKKKGKWQNGCLRRPYKQLRKEARKRQRRKGTINPFERRVPNNSTER